MSEWQNSQKKPNSDCRMLLQEHIEQVFNVWSGVNRVIYGRIDRLLWTNKNFTMIASPAGVVLYNGLLTRNVEEPIF